MVDKQLAASLVVSRSAGGQAASLSSCYLFISRIRECAGSGSRGEGTQVTGAYERFIGEVHFGGDVYFMVIKGYPLPPVYWNHRFAGKRSKNLWATTR